MRREEKIRVVETPRPPKGSNVIEFPKGQLHDAVDFLMEKYDRGHVDNLILAYTFRDVEDEGNPNKLGTYWFGHKSCLTIRGLCRRIDDRIRDYMDEMDDVG